MTVYKELLREQFPYQKKNKKNGSNSFVLRPKSKESHSELKYPAATKFTVQPLELFPANLIYTPAVNLC